MSNIINLKNLMYRCDDCGRLCERENLTDRLVFRCYNRKCGNVWELKMP